MKTYEQILDEVVTREYQRVNPVAVNIHRTIAKEYCKQWLDKLLEALKKNQGYGSMNPDYILRQFKDEIDTQ
jgi:hypothetical protein